jgi:hypothetical protein
VEPACLPACLELEEEQGGEQEERLLGRGGRSGTDTTKLLLDNNEG